MNRGTINVAWVCLVIRCEADGQLKLYVDISGGGEVLDRWTLRVDDSRWFVEGRPNEGPAPFNTEILGDTAEIVEVLRTGRRMFFDALPIPLPYQSIRLEGSARCSTS